MINTLLNKFRNITDLDAREILTAGTIGLILKVVGVALLFTFHAVITRVLGPEDSGVFFLALVLTNFAVIVCKLGTDLVVVKHIAIQSRNGELNKDDGNYALVDLYFYFTSRNGNNTSIIQYNRKYIL